MSGEEGQSGDYIETSEPDSGDPLTGANRPADQKREISKPENPTTLPQTARSHSLTNRLGQHLIRPSRPVIIDSNFSRYSRRYVLQAALATLAILAVLLFVDNLSQAALAAGLGSSVVILFVHPSSHAASPRALIGGHGLALLLGSAFAVLLFAGPVEAFLDGLSPVRDLSLAVSVGLLILTMAVTGTEHPPAAGTVLGFATQPWDLETVGIILGAVALLAAIQRLFRSHLRDLL